MHLFPVDDLHLMHLFPVDDFYWQFPVLWPEIRRVSFHHLVVLYQLEPADCQLLIGLSEVEDSG